VLFCRLPGGFTPGSRGIAGCRLRQREPEGGRAPVVRGLVYLWAGPTTLLGLLMAAASWATGGRLARVSGVLEVWGGVSLPFLVLANANAMTLGHVVLGRSPALLARTRAHERAHVRQVERWGPLFIPAYLAASVWARLRGDHHYFDNWFEVDAERQVRARAEGTDSRSRPHFPF
jgi:hypothetical protein